MEQFDSKPEAPLLSRAARTDLLSLEHRYGSVFGFLIL